MSRFVQILISKFKGSVQRVFLLCNSLQHWLQLTRIQASRIQPSISPGMAAWATMQAGFSTQQLKPHLLWSVFYTICNCSFRVKWKHSILLNSSDICFIYAQERKNATLNTDKKVFDHLHLRQPLFHTILSKQSKALSLNVLHLFNTKLAQKARNI